MEFDDTPNHELFCVENEKNQGRLGRGRYKKHGPVEFKSKNLEAERKRRLKLNNRLITLRALVPIITNMNKATIIDDAITYIKGLQKHVKGLSNKLVEMESEEKENQGSEFDTGQDNKVITKCEVEADVKVTLMDGGSKLCVKIICESKRGGFTKLMEAIKALGFEVTDITVTTSNGATLIMFCVEVLNQMAAVEQVTQFLLETVAGFTNNMDC